MPVKPGAIVEGRIKDLEGVAETIRDLFQDQGIKNKNVAISTGGHSVVIKTITTPKVAEVEIQKTIYDEAEQYIPYDIEDVNIDYQILGESEFYENQLNVLLVAVKKELVAEYIDLISLAGLVPKIIDVDTFALQNCYEHALYQGRTGQDQTIVLLADVGASKTSVNILRGGQSVLMRDNVQGVNQIIAELAHQLEMGAPDAEVIYRNRSKWAEYQGRIEDICRQTVDGWCTEMAEVVHTFQTSGNEGELEKVFISGGGVYVDGFKDKLMSELGCPVEILMPFSGHLEIESQAFSHDFLDEVGPQASIALGLALRRVNDK